MSVEIVRGNFGRRAPADLADQLRKLADLVDQGQLEEMTALYVANGEYQILWAASLESSLAHAALLLKRAADRFEA